MLKSTNATLTDEIQKMARLIQTRGAKCIWVGPPIPSEKYQTEKDFTEIKELMRRTSTQEGCSFIDSSTKTNREGLSDQVHLKCEPAKRWAVDVVGEIEVHLRPSRKGLPSRPAGFN